MSDKNRPGCPESKAKRRWRLVLFEGRISVVVRFLRAATLVPSGYGFRQRSAAKFGSCEFGAGSSGSLAFLGWPIKCKTVGGGI